MMHSRHRIPTIFNLSMVDVLCCALGCVILLWLLNLREAKQRSLAASRAGEQLSLARASLDETMHRLTTAQSRSTEAVRSLAASINEGQAQSQRARAAEVERDRLRDQVAAVQEQLASLEKDRKELEATQEALALRLAKKSRDADAGAAGLATATRQMADREQLLRLADAQVATSAKLVDELSAKLRDADALAAAQKSRLGLLSGTADEARRYRDQASLLDARVAMLKQELSASEQSRIAAAERVDVLRGQTVDLKNQIHRERAASENRFAGMELSGQRVVFLIDMSGSMELVDENTRAPEKWVGVRDAVVRIMRSLPKLEKFQVILFSNKVRYILGSDDGWLEFDPAQSANRVRDALAAVQPKGSTDMYAGLEAAFRLRYLGLDTIYLFSDGLPNVGAGLDAEAARTMPENEREVILSKYIRQMLRTVWNRKVIDHVPVRINTVGFFYESPDVGAFLWALARENDGSFAGMSRP